MIVNRKVIQDEMLRQTLQEEVDRLTPLCNNRHLRHLEEKIRVLENQISYQAYNYNQRLSSLRSIKEHSSRAYAEAVNEKKTRDCCLKQLVDGNRQLLSNLQKTRRQLGDQRKKNNDEAAKSQDLAKEQTAYDEKVKQITSKAEEQQGWIKRLQAAEQLCKRQLSTQREAIQHIKAQIKLQKIGNSSMLQGTQEVRKEIEQARTVKQENYAKIQQQKLLFEQEQKELIKQAACLRQEKEGKLQQVGSLQSKQNMQAEQLLHVNKDIQQREKESSGFQGKIVKNMKLIQEVNNQLFQTRLHKTNSKVKAQQLTEKIERLRRIKADLFNLIC